MSTQISYALQSAFQMDDVEFDSQLVLRYLHTADNNAVAEEELESALKWAHQARTDALLLEGVLDGTLRFHWDNGQISFQLAPEDSTEMPAGTN